MRSLGRAFIGFVSANFFGQVDVQIGGSLDQSFLQSGSDSQSGNDAKSAIISRLAAESQDNQSLFVKHGDRYGSLQFLLLQSIAHCQTGKIGVHPRRLIVVFFPQFDFGSFLQFLIGMLRFNF